MSINSRGLPSVDGDLSHGLPSDDGVGGDVTVYCCCCLANHSMHRWLMSREAQPHFYINVADIDNLESEVSYIACQWQNLCH